MQFQKISPDRRDWNFLGDWGGGVRPIKKLKKCMKLNWNFQTGGMGVVGKTLLLEVWIFSGTTHCHNTTLCGKMWPRSESWKTWIVIELIISISWPGKSWNLSEGHGKSWKSNMLSKNKKGKKIKTIEKNNR